MMKKQGSITVYLCLVLTLVLSLVLGCLESVKNAHARALTVCAMEQGLYSLFAQYDRTLLEEYELFFLNGGYEEGIWQPERLCASLKETAEKVLDPAAGMHIPGAAPAGGTVEQGYFTGYTLATDQCGLAFSRQICEAMYANLGSSGIQLLQKKLREENETLELQEEKKEVYEDDQIMEQYEDTKKQKEEEQDAVQPGEEKDHDAAVPEHFVNPIEVIRKVMTMGILSLVLPEEHGLPDGEADAAQMVSGRRLHSGFGMITVEPEEDFVDKLLTAEYILWKFPCYTDQKNLPGLKCQAEYALIGKSSDRENLAGAAAQLLALRDAANLAYLLSDQGKRMEMEKLSAVIASAIGIPAAAGIVMAALAVCWAFAESILDIRELLDGGKIALCKDGDTWQLSLEHLPDLLEKGDLDRKSSKKGLDYSGYLRILFMKEKQAKLTEGTMDLVEYNMRTIHGCPSFRLDLCIDEMEAGMEVTFGKKQYRIIRSYGYSAGV